MIGDRYEPIEPIGAGGMATVWKARDTLLGRFVAIKRLLPHLADDPAAAARFQREARAAARLVHPGIVTVFDTGDDEEGPFIVLELIEGTTLADQLGQIGRLEPAAVADIVSQVASALDHAHAQGVVHRDIKPANIIVDPGGRARLADFGIARTVEDPTTITATGELVGTITYLAPEILAGEPATPASDVYSLGAVTYQLLAGAPPYTADSNAALVEAVRAGPTPSLRGLASDQMAAAVSAAMSRDPLARPGTAGELAAGLMETATLVMATGPLIRPNQTRTSSEAPTVVTARPQPPTPEPAVGAGAGGGRGRWAVGAAFLGVMALAAAALTADRDPGAKDTGAPLAAATTTAQTTSTITTTTTVAITTTTAATSSTVRTPETAMTEIEALLAGLRPPEFRPKEVRQVEDRLRDIQQEWAGGDREDLARELERAFEETGDLPDSSEREQVMEMLIELAELMGFEVSQSSGEDDDGQD